MKSLEEIHRFYQVCAETTQGWPEETKVRWATEDEHGMMGFDSEVPSSPPFCTLDRERAFKLIEGKEKGQVFEVTTIIIREEIT